MPEKEASMTSRYRESMKAALPASFAAPARARVDGGRGAIEINVAIFIYIEEVAQPVDQEIGDHSHQSRQQYDALLFS
jgi:hypothetical protein